jgi:hypothetical protein
MASVQESPQSEFNVEFPVRLTDTDNAKHHPKARRATAEKRTMPKPKAMEK